ncbi:hypothetical protein JYT95_01140 [bacterium AH-315-J23]|nr:hypothetical protein [bacterium AH-315-J23]PHQ60908.1 MAG: hypothetical protein COC03_00745 [Robiginitomaculum sp.]
MPNKKKTTEGIPFMMLENGKITSNMDYWVGGISSNGYGEVAKCPPIKITTLTENLTDSILASPDPQDADALNALTEELKSSLDIANKTIAVLKQT